MPHLTDQELIEHTHNTSRFFVEHRQIAWAALVVVVAWGVYGYFSMPQRKDPDIPVRVAVAACQWPGATAQEVEQLVTRPIEQTIAENKTSIRRPPTNTASGPFRCRASPSSMSSSPKTSRIPGSSSATSI